jgi:acetyl esterase/lipase
MQMVSPEARVEIARQRERKRELARSYPEGKPLALGRAEWEAEMAQVALSAGARLGALDLGGVPGEWLEMPGAVAGRVFLLLHGGGYSSGSPRTHRPLAALIGEATRTRVIMPDYRLAPEHPFPAGLEDALTSYRWLLAQGLAPENIVVGGDSAGGGLTLSLLLRLRAAGVAQPRAAVLLSPWTDLTMSSPSYDTQRERDPGMTREALQRSAAWYAGATDRADPIASPLFADLHGLPPLLVQVGGAEIMLDDARLVAERAHFGD